MLNSYGHSIFENIMIWITVVRAGSRIHSGMAQDWNTHMQHEVTQNRETHLLYLHHLLDTPVRFRLKEMATDHQLQ
jgi:hypothetical protein